MDPPPEEVDPDHDTTYVLIEEACARGYEVWTAPASSLSLDQSGLSVNAEKYGSDDKTKRQVDVDRFELVWMREDPPFDRNYLFATYLLEYAAPPVINNPTGLRDSNEKLFILEFPELIPPTWVGAELAEAKQFVETVGGKAVVKSLSGYGGEEVHLLTLGDEHFQTIFAELTDDGCRPVMLQKFYPEVRGEGDRRLILLDGRPIGGLTRYPAAGDFRANLHSGGSAGEAYVSPAEEKLCRQIAPELKNRGLYLVGLDLVGGLITEINVTSPTCVQEINRLAGKKLEADILDFAEAILEG